MPRGEFTARMDRLIRQIKASGRAAGVAEVFVAGEIEFRAGTNDEPDEASQGEPQPAVRGAAEGEPSRWIERARSAPRRAERDTAASGASRRGREAYVGVR